MPLICPNINHLVCDTQMGHWPQGACRLVDPHLASESLNPNCLRRCSSPDDNFQKRGQRCIQRHFSCVGHRCHKWLPFNNFWFNFHKELNFFSSQMCWEFVWCPFYLLVAIDAPKLWRIRALIHPKPPNPGEQMCSVQISLLVVTFPSYISRALTTK